MSIDSHTAPAASQPRIRLIALGDELMAGAGDARCLGWLGRAVASAQGSRSDIDLYNAALPGQTSLLLADRWEQDVADRMDAEGVQTGTVIPRVVIGMGRGDIAAGTALARSRLNLAKVLDGLERQQIPSFVVGPPPSRDRGLTRSVHELSAAFADVCSRRRVPFVDMVGGLDGHEQWVEDLGRCDSDLPGQTGYGLMAWLVLHGGFAAWLGMEEN